MMLKLPRSLQWRKPGPLRGQPDLLKLSVEKAGFEVRCKRAKLDFAEHIVNKEQMA